MALAEGQDRTIRALLLTLVAVVAIPAGASARLASPGSLIAFSAKTGAQVAFPRIPGGEVQAIVDDGNGGWYVGGKFATVGGTACPNLVHIRAGGKVDSGWCPRPNATIRALLRIGTTLYVGGEFLHQIAGKARAGLAAFDTKSDALTAWNPGLSGSDESTYALASNAQGTAIYVNGNFQKLGGAKRMNLGAVSAATGHATDFAPNPDEDFHGDSVEAFAVGPHAVYAWGAFSKIGGKPTNGEVALDPATGKQLAGWHPGIKSVVFAALVDGNRVLVGADTLLALDAKTGAHENWSPDTGGAFVGVLAVLGSRVYASLESDHFNAVPHTFVAYDANTGAAVWHGTTSFHGYVNAIAASGDLVLVGGTPGS